MLFDAMPLSEEGEKSDLPGVGLGLTWLAVVLFFPCYFLKIKGGVVVSLFVCFFVLSLFFPYCYEKEKRKERESVCVSEREREKKNPQGK